MAQLKDLIVNGPSRFIGDVYATTFTGNLAGNANTATSATNAGTVAGLSVHSGRNNEANKIVRTDQNGYLQVGYINSSSGHEKNASNPTYVWGSNSSDSYLRSYQTSSLSVNYATSSGSCSGNAATATKAGYLDTGTMTLYANGGNEINFGGTNTSSTIYFGYRATGSKPVPTSFIFGGSGTATLTAGGFKKKDSSASYVLTGDGGHAAISSLSVNYANSSGSCSGNAATATNADTLDGYHASSFYQHKSLRSDQNSIYDLRYNYGTYDKGDFNGTYKDEYPTNYGAYLALTYNDKNTGALMFFDASTSNVLGHIYVRTRGAGDRNTTYSKWGTLAYLTDNVASASKWANARTITLTGSVTGSVSIDGSQDVSLATTTNHTHLYAGSATAGGAANTLLGDYVGGQGPNYFGKNKVGALMMSTAVNSNDTWKDWLILDCYSNDNAGGAVAFGISRETLGAFIMRSNADRVSWAESAELLGTHNYNSYVPKLDGTGATGTWGINISGNSGSANALNLEVIGDLNSVTDNRAFYSYFQALNRPSSNYATGILLKNPNLGRKYQLVFDADGGLFTRHYNSSWQPWKTIAFTDSDISGNAATATNAENISSIYPQLAASLEADEINVKRQIDWNSWGGYGYKLEAAVDFNWYETHNLFGVVRGSSADSAGFGWMYSSDGSTYTPIARLSPDGHLYLASSLTISGAISGVTDITASGHAKVNSLKTDHICIECDNSGNSSDRGSEINNYDGHLYLQHDTSNNCFICTGGGNVLIGTTSNKGQKLQVAGDGYFTDNVITESDFISRGDAIIDGNVGIGTQRPDYNLDVYGNMRITGPIWLDVLNSNGKYFISTEDNGLLGITYDGRDQNPAFLMNSLGYVYLNCETTESPAYPLVVNGTIQCTKLLQTSDIKYKTNIKQIEYEEALKIIENLNPVTWDWNENTVETGSSSGFVAQEAEEFIPNAISRDNKNNLSLDYTQLHSYEIKVIQEQQKEIIKLKEKLKILEKLIS